LIHTEGNELVGEPFDGFLEVFADECGNISMLLMDNSREEKLTSFLNSGKKIPKKGAVVIGIGRKNNDIIMLDKMVLLEDKIYMKLSELK
jgi:hypothetical protein